MPPSRPMLPENALKVLEQMADGVRTLDVGGWHKPINAATHVLDINPYETRLSGQAHDPGAAERFTAGTWHQLDFCDRVPWPFDDKSFDFTVCSHVLEDIRDPIWVLAELSRVSKAGYVECPSPASELLKWPSGTVGLAHHRWFVEMRPPGEVRFYMKPHDLAERRLCIPLSRFSQVDYSRFARGMFWDDSVHGTEVIFDVGDWLQGQLSIAKGLATFAPLARVGGALRRRLRRDADPGYVQPGHGQDGVKYPYI